MIIFSRFNINEDIIYKNELISEIQDDNFDNGWEIIHYKDRIGNNQAYYYIHCDMPKVSICHICKLNCPHCSEKLKQKHTFLYTSGYHLCSVSSSRPVSYTPAVELKLIPL